MRCKISHFNIIPMNPNPISTAFETLLATYGLNPGVVDIQRCVKLVFFESSFKVRGQFIKSILEYDETICILRNRPRCAYFVHPGITTERLHQISEQAVIDASIARRRIREEDLLPKND